LLFSDDPEALSAFYQKVLEREPDWEGGSYTGFQIGDGFITIGPHDKVHGKNEHPERVMLNFETEDVEEEFERIKGLGATVIAEPYTPGEMKDEDGKIATFADPDGNYFQLITPFEPIDMKN
jgi:predicted enzyme related to lactoylglutathione lyase